jgi:hypothetical protein
MMSAGQPYPIPWLPTSMHDKRERVPTPGRVHTYTTFLQPASQTDVRTVTPLPNAAA